MKKKHYLHLSKLSLLILSTLEMNPLLAGSNFNITPAAPLPTIIYPGETVTAFYTVTNNTKTARHSYTVQGLPSTVTQITSGSLCSSPINLAAYASCTLQFNITDAVHSGFSLCKGNSCTKSSVDLNVRLPNSLRLATVGYYINNVGDFSPLGYTSTNQGVSWNLSANPLPLPGDVATSDQRTALFAITCDSAGLQCSAVGGYKNRSTDEAPLSYTSINGGGVWNLSTNPLPLPSDVATITTMVALPRD